MINVLNNHSDKYLEMAFDSKRLERVENPDGYGKRKGDCGDTIEMFLSISSNKIKHINFSIDGCINTVACANTIARLAEGKTINEAWGVSPESVIEYLETLPEHEKHCAELAASVFYQALVNYKKNSQESWKKPYLRN